MAGGTGHGGGAAKFSLPAQRPCGSAHFLCWRLPRMIIEIRPASICDVYALTRNLRPDDRLEVTSLALDPAKALRLDFRHATVRYSAFVDTRIAAMWGMSGMMLGDIGYPWLLTTREVELAPV